MQETGRQASTSEILSAWFAALGRHSGVCLMAAALLAAAGALFDLSLGSRGGTLPNMILGIVVQYHLVEHVLNKEFGLRSTKRRYGSVFASSFLATLGMLGGLVLLIVPGLYLAARWSISIPLVVGEQYGAVDSLRESWKRTQSSAWPIIGCFALVALMFLLAFAALAILQFVPGVEPAGEDSLVEALASNTLGGVLSVALSVLGTAIYGQITRPQGGLDEVFS